MNTTDIKIFSLDTVTQEEKEFLEYNGDDLKKMTTKRLNRLHWWVQAFQAVKAGKRPKFNWAAFFSFGFWDLRKNNFLFYIILGLVVLPIQLICHNSLSLEINICIELLLIGGASGIGGPRFLIRNYFNLANKQNIKKGTLSFVFVFLPFCVSAILGIIYSDYQNIPNKNMIFTTFLDTIYVLILMKLWLPVKKEKNNE